MSHGKDYLHSHSGIEREIRLPKHFVLVDEKYRDMFDPKTTEDFSVKQDGRVLNFLKVPIMDFVKNNGVFKNLNS